MKEKIKLYGSILILVIFVPYLITVYLQGGGLFFSESRSDQTMEEQLIGVLAEEIPASCESECIKAQAVIARTNLVSGSGEGWTEAEMKQAWGEHYEQYLEKIKNAVSHTRGEILTCEGKPIQAAFHAVSSKKTRTAGEVPGQEAYTYLVGVDSSADIEAENFLSIRYVSKQEAADALQKVFEEETVTAEQLPGALQITGRDSADYVTKVKYNRTVANGEAVRSALNLPSACFYLSELDGQIRIVTKGIGHGLGLSQYGANEMAKKGYKYREILDYYFHNVEITQYQQ